MSSAPRPEPQPPAGGWSALVVPAGGCVLGFVVLLVLPELPSGTWLSERLRLHLVWPVLPLGLATVFWAIGARRHRATGRPYFAPVRTAACVAVLVFVPISLVIGVGPGWSVWWALGVMVAFALTARWLVKGWFVYSEVWRTAFNGHVVRFVRAQLEQDAEGAILAHTRHRRRRVHGEPPWLLMLAAASAAARWGWWRTALKLTARLTGPVARWRWAAGWDCWGSPHFLAVIEEHYENQKQLVLTHARGRTAPPAVLEQYRLAGDCLTAFRLLDWADRTIADAAPQRIAEVRREMLAIDLWFGAPATCAKRHRQYLDRSPDGSGLFDHLPAGWEEYRSFWLDLIPAVCAAVSVAEPLAPEAEQDLIARAVRTFRQIREEQGRADKNRAPRPVPDRDTVEVCALVWLALANRVSDAARLDVWLSARPAHDPGLPLSADDRAPETVFARLALEDLYRRWADRLPPPWAVGLKSQAERAFAGSLEGRRASVAALLRKPQ